jgi:hypothetical protein
MTKKKTAKTKTVKDYLRLPFEVHYHRLSYTSLELLSEDYKITQPSDFKGIRVEQGNARGVTFYCAENTGAELMCCLTDSHEQTVPVWLSMIDEEDLNINYGQKIGLEIDGNSLNKIEADPDDLEDFVDSGYCTEFYSLEEESIDYIILDADGDRIKIDEYGRASEMSEDEDEGELIIDVENLSQDESLSNYSTMSNSEAQDMWIINLWVEKFPTLPVPTICKYAV